VNLPFIAERDDEAAGLFDPARRLPDGTVICESAAIVLVIGERHPESPLVPMIGDADRPTFLYWLLYMATSVYMTFVRSNHPERFTTDVASTEPIRAAALDAVDRQFSVV
jgi:glutathione S-transferase